MAKKKKGGKQNIVTHEGVRKRIVVHDDKSKFFNRDMRSALFFMIWIGGFLALMLWYSAF